MDDGEFEFDFFSGSRTATGDETGEVLWEEDPSDPHGHDLHGFDPHGADPHESEPRRRRDPATAPPPQVVMRRRVALAAAIALLLLIILLIVVTSGGGGGGGGYRGYLQKVTPIASDSEQTGAALAAALGGTQSSKTLSAKLDDLILRTVRDITQLQALTPPKALLPVQSQALAALDLRLRGLQGVRDSLSQASGTTDTSWAAVLSSQVDDLIASDTIWDGSVRAPANGVLQAGGLGGTFFPQSRFVTNATSLRKSIGTLLAGGSVATTGPVLKLGDTGPAVTSWQTQLNAWLKATGSTQTPLTPDGNFGTSTQTTTQALQTSAGLTPDGIVGPSTRQALHTAVAGTKTSSATATAAPVIKLGDTGPAVTSWQTQLNAWLKATGSTQTPLTPDGNFGTSTQTTTQALQTSAGLTPDGIVGPSTRQALHTAVVNGSRG